MPAKPTASTQGLITRRASEIKPQVLRWRWQNNIQLEAAKNASNALADSQDVISKYPSLKGIFGFSSVSFPGAAEAVEQSGKGGQVLVTGLSTPNDMKKFVHNGNVRSVVLWNTIDLGYLTIHVAKALATGELKDEATSI